MIILVSANLEMCLDGMQRCIVQLLLKACQHCLVLADVVDDWHHHSEGVLPWLQGSIGPGKLEEDEDLLLVSNDAGLAHREDVGSYRRYGQTEGDGPLELVLKDQLWLELQSHQLDDVLQRLLGTVQQPAEPTEEGRSVGRGHNLIITSRQN